ncbi:MAG: hypothetical protein OEY86_20285, partial [Nitrospira sp.]|nr:hypothetical protein [Nitrospira sp.]
MFQDFPTAAMDPLREEAGSRVYIGQPGNLGGVLSDLRVALITVADAGPKAGRTIRAFGEDMKQLQYSLAQSDNADEMSDIRFSSAQASQVTRCVTTHLNSVSIDPVSAGAKGAAALATCADSMLQISFAGQLSELEEENNALGRAMAVSDFNSRFMVRSAELEDAVSALATNLERVDQSLGQLRTLKKRAEGSLEKALWLLSQQAQTEPKIVAALAAKRNTASTRYRRAHKNAKRMAFTAKRAVEQRLGMSLSEMIEELPLVEAPQSWEATVCNTAGIDYDAISSGSGPTDFAGTFIGDYVSKLERVVESYRMKYGFHEGTDQAVVSLRDDIHNVRAKCEEPSRNLLYHSSDLNHRFGAEVADQKGWFISGCTSDCIDMTGSVEGSPVVNFDGKPVEVFTWIPSAGSCSAVLEQKVELEPGRYRLTYYKSPNYALVDTSALIYVPGAAYIDSYVQMLDGGFSRSYYIWDVLEPLTARVGFRQPCYLDSPILPEVKIAAPMLEKVADGINDVDMYQLRPYEETGDTLSVQRAVCEDTFGEVFRAKNWTRSCLKVCPDGYVSDCFDGAKTECYWETSFSVDQRSIEQGRLFGNSGFAKG